MTRSKTRKNFARSQNHPCQSVPIVRIQWRFKIWSDVCTNRPGRCQRQSGKFSEKKNCLLAWRFAKFQSGVTLNQKACSRECAVKPLGKRQVGERGVRPDFQCSGSQCPGSKAIWRHCANLPVFPSQIQVGFGGFLHASHRGCSSHQS